MHQIAKLYVGMKNRMKIYAILDENTKNTDTKITTATTNIQIVQDPCRGNANSHWRRQKENVQLMRKKRSYRIQVPLTCLFMA